MTVQNQLLTEKYRPETLDEIVGHDPIVDRLQKFLEADLAEGSGGGLQHCLFAGPAGTGKTTAASAYAAEVFGDDWRQNMKEFNASDDRGIDIVRDKIKEWCRTNPAEGAPYKIVFLDEADQLTNDAQSALRRIMEQYSDTTRFILSCNYSNQILDPIKSRCAPFHFNRLDDADIRDVIQRVVDGEDIDAEEGAIERIAYAVDGDARRAVNTVAMSMHDGELTEETVQTVVGVVDDQLVYEICQQAVSGDLDDAMKRLDVELLKNGANYQALIKSMFRAIQRIDMAPDARVKCIDILATTDERLRSGLNPHVQFHNLLGHMHMTQGLSTYRQQGGE